jgi:hypothetical protein
MRGPDGPVVVGGFINIIYPEPFLILAPGMVGPQLFKGYGTESLLSVRSRVPGQFSRSV